MRTWLTPRNAPNPRVKESRDVTIPPRPPLASNSSNASTHSPNQCLHSTHGSPFASLAGRGARPQRKAAGNVWGNFIVCYPGKCHDLVFTPRSQQVLLLHARFSWIYTSWGQAMLVCHSHRWRPSLPAYRMQTKPPPFLGRGQWSRGVSSAGRVRAPCTKQTPLWLPQQPTPTWQVVKLSTALLVPFPTLNSRTHHVFVNLGYSKWHWQPLPFRFSSTSLVFRRVFILWITLTLVDCWAKVAPRVGNSAAAAATSPLLWQTTQRIRLLNGLKVAVGLFQMKSYARCAQADVCAEKIAFRNRSLFDQNKWLTPTCCFTARNLQGQILANYHTNIL